MVELALPDTVTRPPTYWIEGAIIGGSVLGVATFAFSYTICKDLAEDGNCLGDAAGDAALMAFGGALIGALIGGGFEKNKSEEASRERPPPPP